MTSCITGNQKFTGSTRKHYREKLESTKVIPQFDESVRYYLVKDGVFTVVKSKGSVLKVLSDHKSEVKNFIRKNRIAFKGNRDEALVRVTQFYDTLTD